MAGPDEADTVFGPYRLDRRNRSLTCNGAAVALGGRAFDTLATLVAAEGATVGKEALLDAVWPGLTVEENNLQVQISALRKALGDGWIVTVPGRGYRLAPPPAAGPATALPLPNGPSVAVLPFANLSGDPEQEYFADGMVEDITTALSRISGLFVIARNSSFTYKGRAVDVKQVGRELGVRYLVEGSVRKAGGRVRITCQLVNAATGAHVWAEKFDSPLGDIFELQDRVAESVAGAVEPTLRNTEIARALSKPTENLDAYDLYLRALAHYDLFTAESREEALRLLRRAVALDPRFARALGLFGQCVSLKFMSGATTRGSPEALEAVAMARAGLAAAGDDPTALRDAGFTLTYLAGERDVGRAALDRALILNPNSALVLMDSGALHNFAGNWSKARDEYERAIRLSPIDPELRFGLTGLAIAMIELGEVSAAEEFARKAVAAGSGRPTLIRALVRLGRLDEAREVAGRLLQSLPGYTISTYRLGNYLYPPDYIERSCDTLRAAGIPE